MGLFLRPANRSLHLLFDSTPVYELVMNVIKSPVHPHTATPYIALYRLEAFLLFSKLHQIVENARPDAISRFICAFLYVFVAHRQNLVKNHAQTKPIKAAISFPAQRIIVIIYDHSSIVRGAT